MHTTRAAGGCRSFSWRQGAYTVRGELPGSRDNYVHFIQEPSTSQASCGPTPSGMDAALGVMTKERSRRAHTVAHSDPMGPVYLMLRERR